MKKEESTELVIPKIGNKDTESEIKGTESERKEIKNEIQETETEIQATETGTQPSGQLPAVPFLAGISLTTVLAVAAALLAGVLAGWIMRDRRKNKSMTEHESDTLQPVTEELLPEKEQPESYAVGRVHHIGARSGQQDSFAVSDVTDRALCADKGVIAIVADGMGGLSDGDRISSMVTLSMFRNFHERADMGDGSELLLQMLSEANAEVNHFLGANTGKCGSTLVAGMIHHRKCSWISVGDSHIYLYRNGTLLQLNREHVYRETLDAKIANAQMSVEEARQTPNRGALTSYLGMGYLEKVDRNLTPLVLQPGDRILFMTDGVFGTISDAQIISAMAYPVEESAAKIDQMVQAAGKRNQDNYTAVILECC